MDSMSSTARRAASHSIGRVIGKRLTDELGDRVALIVDGVVAARIMWRSVTRRSRGRADGVNR